MLKITFIKHRLFKISITYVYITTEVNKMIQPQIITGIN